MSQGQIKPSASALPLQHTPSTGRCRLGLQASDRTNKLCLFRTRQTCKTHHLLSLESLPVPFATGRTRLTTAESSVCKTSTCLVEPLRSTLELWRLYKSICRTSCPSYIFVPQSLDIDRLGDHVRQQDLVGEVDGVVLVLAPLFPRRHNEGIPTHGGEISQAAWRLLSMPQDDTTL